MKRNVILLCIASVVIYVIQLLVFKDPNTTGFYILQDLAFLPISIAVATVVVGEYLEQKDKKERQEKTQMLCSGFFSEMGNELLQVIFPICLEKENIKNLFETSEIKDDKSFDAMREKLKVVPMHVELDGKSYDQVNKIICERRDVLLILSSNPLLLDHADFTKLIWGLFHLTDEFRLRGNYETLKKADLAHIEEDFSEILRYLLINWARNRVYTRKNFPNYYSSSIGVILDTLSNKCSR